MIIDVHTHTPEFRDPVPEDQVEWNRVWRPDRPVKATVSWEDYLEGTRGADKCIVFGIQMKEGPDPNPATAELVRAYPDRLIGFVSVHPDDPEALEKIDQARQSWGLRGIKLGPNYQDFDPLKESACAVYEKAQSLGWPILFHQGTSPVRTAPLEYAHPLVMDRIALRFPELRVVMAHLGHPWQADTLVVIRKHPHVYADTSALFYRPWSLYNCMRLATEWGVLHKLLFGTDFPVTTVQESIEGLLSVNHILEGTALPRVPEEALEEIIHRDSLKLLGLE